MSTTSFTAYIDIDWDHFDMTELTREQYCDVLEKEIKENVPGVEDVEAIPQP